MTKHVIIDWANVCHNKYEWKNNNWETEDELNTVREILTKIKSKIDSEDIKLYIIFPYSGKTLPSFASAGDKSIFLPDDIMENTEIWWCGGFNINEGSPRNKIRRFKKKCYVSKKNNPLHSCSSPDDLFILWKLSMIDDFDNTYLVTSDKFGSEKKFIEICNENKIESLNDLIKICGDYAEQELPCTLKKDKDKYYWYYLSSDIKKQKVKFMESFNKLLEDETHIIPSTSLIEMKSSSKKTKKRHKTRKHKRKQTKKPKRKQTKKKPKKKEINKIFQMKIPNNRNIRWVWLVRKREDGRYIVRYPKKNILINQLSKKRDKDFYPQKLAPKNSKILR